MHAEVVTDGMTCLDLGAEMSGKWNKTGYELISRMSDIFPNKKFKRKLLILKEKC